MSEIREKYEKKEKRHARWSAQAKHAGATPPNRRYAAVKTRKRSASAGARTLTQLEQIVVLAVNIAADGGGAADGLYVGLLHEDLASLFRTSS